MVNLNVMWIIAEYYCAGARRTGSAAIMHKFDMQGCQPIYESIWNWNIISKVLEAEKREAAKVKVTFIGKEIMQTKIQNENEKER